MVKYRYDAWGNHGVEVVDSDYATLANLNPFRYRSYYYDTETELYYLQMRYYDPEISRFEMIRQGIMTGIKGGIAFVTGMAMATAGLYCIRR